MKIQVLSADTAAKLAAGEVIERPAAVVRELLDNAIDAGAKRITVSVAHGGLDLIKISDDGAGFEREDLLVCTERHSTSKIAAIEDLSRITSLGFRGEALHSIAAVSRMKIRTRPLGRAGAEAEFEGLRLVRVAAVGGPEGTQVEVRNLFFNTPARLRFLKGPSAEAARVEACVRRYVLGRPDISFRLLIDEREAVRSPGAGSVPDALAAVYGLRVGQMLLPIEAEGTSASVSGCVSSPSLSRSNRSDMHIFVNGRWVQSRSLLFAVQEAYSSLLMVGRFPITVLYVRVPPDQLDVNVHPAKSEVRFADERGVASLAGRAVRGTLLHRQTEEAESDSPAEIRQFELQPSTHYRSDQAEPAGFALPDSTLGGLVSVPPSETLLGQGQTSDPGEAAEPGGRFPPLRILGQMAGTYIIAEGPEGMCLIDQHAAHERVLLERFQDALAGAPAESQTLLQPVVVPLSPGQAARMAAFVQELSALGFEAEAFGADSLLLRSVPAAVPASRAGSLIESLEQGMEGLDSVDERRRAMLATMACHSAIRAGQVLEGTQMRALVRDLERTRVPTACAHGRPTLLELSRAQLEREFGRRGSR